MIYIFFRIIMTEIQHNSTIQKTVAYYGNETFPLAHVPFNFKLFHLNRDSNANDFINMHKFWLDNMPKAKGMVANWIVSSSISFQPKMSFIILWHTDLKTITSCHLSGNEH